MRTELFAFQEEAVNELRRRAAIAQDSYARYRIPQVISLQAPTGSGKTLMMTALIEAVYSGTEDFPAQRDAVFVWLSDSPALNAQSMSKIIRKSDVIRPGQCIVVSDESFDMRILDDGHIYFLNTQKLGRSGNLGRHSDMRQFTVWETVENTSREKSGRFYVIIDEAHRGMQGREAGRATTIMQRFIKGSSDCGLKPVPVVIGMSATAERFNTLAGSTSSSLQKVIVLPSDVRDSGLLKDRIIISYPKDPSRQNDMAVLQAACDEWREKCGRWSEYTKSEGIEDVRPVFLVQVQAGSGDKVSSTNLAEVIAAIEERTGENFREHEAVHTFGSAGTLTLNGLKVHHADPERISDDTRIKLVFFKENLSTGWDCPRAETMMSFRRAEDATYIAQLLGRMIRTPLQRRIAADDSLNEVRLFLPYFDRETVRNVVDALQDTEGGEIPAVVDDEPLGEGRYVSWTVHPRRQAGNVTLPGQIMIPSDDMPGGNPPVFTRTITPHTLSQPQQTDPPSQQVDIPGLILDRAAITRFINSQAYVTYTVRRRKVKSYLKSLVSLAGLLTIEGIFPEANEEVRREVTEMIHSYADDLRESGRYDALSRGITEFRLSSSVFDAFGGEAGCFRAGDIVAQSYTELDRREEAADVKMGMAGFPRAYGRRFASGRDYDTCKVDCVLFAEDDSCMAGLNDYAERKFHALDDEYRRVVAGKSERCRRDYDAIISDSDIVSKHSFRLPENFTARTDESGRVYTDHLFADDDGNASISLNGWESGLIDEEEGRSDFVCWLRNPPRQAWALCLPYSAGKETRAFYPDFLIVRNDSRSGYVMDILEPHNPGYSDNLGKAKSLADYVRNEPRIGRVQLIRRGRDASGRDKFIRLDMSKGAVREKVLQSMSNDDIDQIFIGMGE